MKRLFFKYLWGTAIKWATLIALAEVLFQVPVYIIRYPDGDILLSIAWIVLLVILFFIQIREKIKKNE
jgi:L-asparagine transporter-like permease